MNRKKLTPKTHAEKPDLDGSPEKIVRRLWRKAKSYKSLAYGLIYVECEGITLGVGFNEEAAWRNALKRISRRR
jgi:hypothetical protein